MNEEVSILDYLKVIWKKRDVVLLIILVSLISAAIFCSVLPPKYEATTTILLPTKSNSLSGLSSIISEFPVVMPLDLKSSLLQRSTNFKDILKSETLAEMVINGLNLEREFPKVKSKDSLVRKLQKMVKVREGKGIITLAVETGSPRLSRDIANYYILALEGYNQQNNVLIATKTRIFIKEQLAEARADLALAEEKLQKFKSESMKVKVSDRELILARLLRDVRVKEALYALLLEEYEKSKIEEAREAQFFEILDPAKLPGSPSKPKVVLSLAASLLLGFFIGSFTAFLFEYLEGFGIKTPNIANIKIGRRPHAKTDPR